eukprot:s7553_g1.t1
MSQLASCNAPFGTHIYCREDPEYNIRLTQDGLQEWFCQVHKAEKYTWFEKLLANSDATFVQINPASRPLQTVGPYKKYLERKQKEAKHSARTLVIPPGSSRYAEAAGTMCYKSLWRTH